MRYHGYSSEEDEWRPLTDLRTYMTRAPTGWHAASRQAGEAVEVSWAPPGHPTSFWDARVLSTGKAARSAQCKVRFDGFGAGWDESIPSKSRRLRPPGERVIW